MNQKISLVICLVIFMFMVQMDRSFARPSRANRRKMGRENKAKRTWSESSQNKLIVNKESNNDITFPSIVENDVNGDLKGSDKLPPNKWLELERTLPAVLNSPLNSDLTLECVGVGSPPPRVFWLKDGKPIDHMTSFDVDKLANRVFEWNTITKRVYNEVESDFSMANVKAKLPLRCLRPEDQGEYTCVAENEGRQLVASTMLTIDDDFTQEMRPECILQYTKKGKKIQPAFIMSFEYLHMESIGNDVILNCHVVGRPRPQVTWLDLEGKHITDGKKFRVTDSGSLVIKNIGWREMGEYTCRAENEFGSDSASTFLYPLLNEPSS